MSFVIKADGVSLELELGISELDGQVIEPRHSRLSSQRAEERVPKSESGRRRGVDARGNAELAVAERVIAQSAVQKNLEPLPEWLLIAQNAAEFELRFRSGADYRRNGRVADCRGSDAGVNVKEPFHDADCNRRGVRRVAPRAVDLQPGVDGNPDVVRQSTDPRPRADSGPLPAADALRNTRLHLEV